MIRIIGAAALLVVAFVGARTYIASSGAGDDFRIRIAGKAFSPSLNLDVTINAQQHKNGKVTGMSKVPDNFKGKIVELASSEPIELTSPSAGKDFWCVNLKLKGDNEITNWLWFVKDIPGGPDQLSFDAGNGITCAGAGTPVQPFEAISSGDFTVAVK